MSINLQTDSLLETKCYHENTEISWCCADKQHTVSAGVLREAVDVPSDMQHRRA